MKFNTALEALAISLRQEEETEDIKIRKEAKLPVHKKDMSDHKTTTRTNNQSSDVTGQLIIF